MAHRDHYCKSTLWTTQCVTDLSFCSLLQVKIMYKEDQVMAKGGCQDCNMPNQTFKKCRNEDNKGYTLFTLHPKSATEWANG